MHNQTHLEKIFQPRSIAVFGASEREHSVGRKVFCNLLNSQFAGKLYPINPKHKKVFGHTCYASLNEVNDVDLAVIVTPAATVPTILRQCGEKNIHSAIIISAGFSETGEKGKELEQNILDIAKQYQIHFIGPNCLGVMRPSSHLNATFDNNDALPGDIALVSQSGAICAAILDWAMEREIGFSTIVSMGNSIDLDFGDVLEFLAHDKKTKSILLYIEGVHYPERFMQGLRAASAKKAVIALKAGRNTSGVRAVHSHTGALVGDDDIFTAALNRGGAVRVDSIEQLFTAAQVLSNSHRASGNKLMIVTNGGGAGVMAADHATDLNLTLPEPNEKLLSTLNSILPTAWSHQNPIDMLGDATPERYRQVVEACLQDEDSDGLISILVPVAMSQPLHVAKEICQFEQQSKKPLIACWMGDKQSKSSRQLFAEHHIPCFSTPEVAVEAFSYLSRYFHNQKLLAQLPSKKMNSKNNFSLAKKIIATAQNEKRDTLTMQETKQLLASIDLPITKSIEAMTADEAVSAAEQIGYPVAIKILSPDITHKQDVGGVKLNIATPEAVRKAFDNIMSAAKSHAPTAKMLGVTVEHMQQNPNDRELMIGVLRDPVFGSVITFGMGGSLVEVIRDRAIGLPPLNDFLARHLIAETRAAKMLDEFRGKPPVKINLLIDILLRISDLVIEFPKIKEMDINPLLINDKDAIVVDARLMIDTKNANSG
ncbi:MAG: hypothetical protein ACD_46C00082G0001 [uncultured bacterium]|nr:MAG: hypothetical protein ACD_46C00082G0001 [uncultured bacterium]